MAQAAVTSLVGLVFGKANEEISYMWNCSKNVDDLKRENQNLTQMRGRVQQMITAAEGKGETLLEGVEEWKDKADSHISEAREVIDGFEADKEITCFNLGLCFYLRTRYRYGKQAATKAPSLLQVQEEGRWLESSVSVRSSALGVPYVKQNIDGLDTHKLCIEKIMKSIEDEDIQIIGIYGMGGVGKTTLAKEVAIEVESLNLFADVKFITVSQPVNAKRIKDVVQAPANRIMNGEKILVIFDDVWEELKLDELGIPRGADYKNCKILLTSRSKDVCETMKADLISVGSLKPEEAY